MIPHFGRRDLDTCLDTLKVGTIFFGGLWWTIRKGVSSKQPALWFFCSLLLRMVIALAGFYFVGRGHWQRLVVCLLGFVMARVVVTLLPRPPVERHLSVGKESSHAP